jgi:hypothetical protein
LEYYDVGKLKILNGLTNYMRVDHMEGLTKKPTNNHGGNWIYSLGICNPTSVIVFTKSCGNLWLMGPHLRFDMKNSNLYI